MGLKVHLCLVYIFLYFHVTYGCDVDDMALYKVSFKTFWSLETFPKDYPLRRPKAQWSQVYGQSHNSSTMLYRVGEPVPPTMNNFALYGQMDDLVKESEQDPKVYDQFLAPAIRAGVGETENSIFVDGGHSLVSIVSRIIPSPDWFVGVDSLNLCVDSSWIEQVTMDLEPLDGGVSSGLTFTAPRYKTVPPAAVMHHRPRTPDHPAAGFYYPDLKELPAIGQLTVTKVKEYSSKEINNLAKKQLLVKLQLKDKRKGWPKVKENKVPKEIALEEITTKNYLDQLKDLEEDPASTPQIDKADNNVIVVTTPPTTTTTEAEFDDELKTMDEVVLAVAKGHKLGLGRHLPRHFRSRLHHAVNRIQPEDCLVSEWGEWSPCSVTCGFGDKFRYRTVVRQKTGRGRKCPALTDRTHCGNINSCAHIDYFEW